MQLYFIRHAQSVNNFLYAQSGSSRGRSEDPELTDLGRIQALYLAVYLSDLSHFEPSDITRRVQKMQQERQGSAPDPAQPGGLTHLYTSLMVRAVETGALISEALGLPLIGWVDLHEGGGIFQDPADLDPPADQVSAPTAPGAQRIGLPGKPRAYFEARNPRLVLPEEVGAAGWWNRPFEPYHERPPRAERVLQELLRRHGGLRPDGSEDRVALISHGGFYNHLMRALLKIPPCLAEDELSDLWFALNNAAITRIDFLEGQFLVVYQNRCHYLPPELIS